MTLSPEPPPLSSFIGGTQTLSASELTAQNTVARAIADGPLDALAAQLLEATGAALTIDFLRAKSLATTELLDHLSSALCGFAIAPLGQPDAAIFVELPTPLAAILVQRILGREMPDPGLHLPEMELTPTELGALLYLAGRTLAALEEGWAVHAPFATPAGLLTALHHRAPRALMREYEVSLDTPQAKVRGAVRVWIPLDGRSAFAQVKGADLRLSLDATLRVTIASGHLNTHALRALAIGDWLLLEQRLHPWLATLWLSGRARARCEVGAKGSDALEVLSPLHYDPKPMPLETHAATIPPEGDPDSTAERPSLSELADVEIELQLEVARFTLPLSALQDVVPGTIFKTDVPILDHVKLCAGDKTLAEGRLVECDGAIGIEIERIFK